MIPALCLHCAGRPTIASRRAPPPARDGAAEVDARDAAEVGAAVDVATGDAGETAAAPAPVRVIDFAVDDEDLCVILEDRSVRCVPHEFLGNPEAEATVTTVADLPPAHHIDANGRRVCIRDGDGAVWCWGSIDWCDDDIQIEAPQRVPMLPVGAEVALPLRRHSDGGNRIQARTPTGVVINLDCAGENRSPTAFGGAVRQLAAGSITTCALVQDATVRCTDEERPLERVAGLVRPEEVRIGDQHACARQADGAVRCWPVCHRRGGTTYNCVWNRARGSVIRTWPVPGLESVGAVATGDEISCALKQDRSVWCWTMSGGTVDPRRGLTFGAPFPVPGLSEVERIDLEGVTLCALRRDRTLWCVQQPQPDRPPQRMVW